MITFDGLGIIVGWFEEYDSLLRADSRYFTTSMFGTRFSFASTNGISLLPSIFSIITAGSTKSWLSMMLSCPRSIHNDLATVRYSHLPLIPLPLMDMRRSPLRRKIYFCWFPSSSISTHGCSTRRSILSSVWLYCLRRGNRFLM